MVPLGGILGIQNHTASVAAELALIVFGVVWLALIYWTFADARRRVGDGWLVGCATLVSLIPFIGSILYAIVRPPEYLEDVRERALEIQAVEARLSELGVLACPHCDYQIERDFLRCPNCLRKLKESCSSCGKPLAREWQICPYCETERGIDPTLSRRSRRSRRESLPEPVVTPPPADLI